jgi:hypothetical protein
VGHCGAEISNLFKSNKFSSFALEGLETTLFQNGCLALRSPASSDLCRLYVCMYVCKGWAIKLAPAPRPSMIYCATPTASPLLILHFE